MFDTVNSEIFMGVLFSLNFADAEFHEIKPWQNGKITLLTDVGKSYASRNFKSRKHVF